MYYILFLLTILSINIGFAKGTLAESIIKNSAVASFSVNDINYSIQSNIDSFVVDRVVDIKLNWQNSAPIEVGANEKQRVLEFLLTNLGNSKDEINLSYEKNATSNFGLENIALYKDTNGNKVLDINDTKVEKINLNADANTLLFLVGDIPKNVDIKQKSIYKLEAISTAKESNSSDNKDKVDVVFRNEKDKAFGEYIVRDYWLEAKKFSKVLSEDNKTHTGSRIHYEIVLKIGGNNKNKEINNLYLKDNIPPLSKYVLGSLSLNDKNLTDANDSDEGMFDGEKIITLIDSIKDKESKKVAFDVIVQ